MMITLRIIHLNGDEKLITLPDMPGLMKMLNGLYITAGARAIEIVETRHV